MRLRAIGCSVLVLGLWGCGQPVRYEKVDGPYIVVAADVAEDRHLAYDLGDGASIGRVPATVIGVGHDDRYITVQRQPQAAPQTIEYYYVVRDLDGRHASAEAVKGPFDEPTFRAEVARLNLPDLKPVH